LKQCLRWVNLALASGLFLSYLPAWLLRTKRFTGAGLVGSLWGVALLPALAVSVHRQAVVWLGAVMIAVAVSDAAEEALGVTDDSRIVIDEVVGLWTAILFLPHSVPMIVLAFVLFRVFDVAKPGWIRRSGNLPGGWGVVFDDVLAGAAANVCLHLVQFIHPL
jgi:phosphatidylglycerophosphatase A